MYLIVVIGLIVLLSASVSTVTQCRPKVVNGFPRVVNGFPSEPISAVIGREHIRPQVNDSISVTIIMVDVDEFGGQPALSRRE